MTLESQKHRDAILRAFNDVVNDKTSTDWALFGYEGQTNVLKVVGTGEDGLEEMAEDLNSSKIMYAVVRVTDPKTTRPKVVLINWQGEGAPMQRKGMCARHLNDVHKLLRGVHVTVNARTEEEVEPEVVMAAVQKASATTYNFSERSEVNDKTTPVGTNYKRTNPLAEIDSKSRNKFWEEQEAEERRRKTEEQQKKDEELRKLETERKQREINDAQQRDRLTKERNARILAERKAEEAAAQRCAAQNDLKWQQDLESQHQEEFERARRAEQMRLERKKEAESLIGQRMHSTRAMFESGISNSQQTADKNRPPPRKLKEFNPVNSQGSREEIHDRGTSAPSRGVAARWPPAAATETQPTTPSHTREMLNSSVVTSHSRTPVQASYSASSSPPAAPIKQPPETSQPHSNGDLSHDYYDRSVVSNKVNNTIVTQEATTYETSIYSNIPNNDDVYETTVQSNSATTGASFNKASTGMGMVYEVDGVEYQILPEHGLCARALYDYQAADDSEITFDPAEIITNIDQIDEGWWQGVGPDGMFGLFPANYVELING